MEETKKGVDGSLESQKDSSELGLADIKAEIEKLNAELRGFQSGDEEGDLPDLQERASFRQVLEEILFHFQALHPPSKKVSGRARKNRPAFDVDAETGNGLIFGDSISSEYGICSLTDAENQLTLSDDIDKVKLSSATLLVDGFSVKEKSLDKLSQAVLHPYSLVVEICNFLDVELYQLDCNWIAGITLDLPLVIEPRRREWLTMSMAGYGFKHNVVEESNVTISTEL